MTETDPLILCASTILQSHRHNRCFHSIYPYFTSYKKQLLHCPANAIDNFTRGSQGLH